MSKFWAKLYKFYLIFFTFPNISLTHNHILTEKSTYLSNRGIRIAFSDHYVSGVRREGTTVLNIFNDRDYNRSVVTIVATIDSVGEHSFTSVLPREGRRRGSCMLSLSPWKISCNKLCHAVKHTQKKVRMHFSGEDHSEQFDVILREKSPDAAGVAVQVYSRPD